MGDSKLDTDGSMPLAANRPEYPVRAIALLEVALGEHFDRAES